MVMIRRLRVGTRSAAAFWVVGTVRVDIEVDLIDAALGLGMAIAGVPGPSRSWASVTLARKRYFQSPPGGNSELLLPANWKVRAFSCPFL